jgi:serine/threonine protein kinase/Tfp pilus assembly protein PilF
MSQTPLSTTWDDTLSPAVASLLQRFEADWRSASGPRPDPTAYLPDDPLERPAALLTLLRADLVLRWRAREPCPIESYRARYPELDSEILVALLYEEYSLREEAGESPEPGDYTDRFPDIAHSFQDVLEIHGLFGHARIPASCGPCEHATPLPEVGQTIAGFRLVEELGRGSFARVYLAEERHLADRPVALKVTRTGSREPQTLARLQHTHIVPVYSYRIDPATGLHLLCMPYLGRITLLQVLSHREITSARTGADLLDVLDQIQPIQGDLEKRAASRVALARRSYAQAIAWWGARMAEALQHAHDRQVLHRDVKPSNVLMNADGLPMLLDFNLAHEPFLDQTQASFGGTLAYMAPEQLEALAYGGSNHVDARTDLYALGVVLFDCLVRGTQSFAITSNAMTMTETLLSTAAARRAGAPRIRTTHPDVPPALEEVVRRCLAADPGDRYVSAAHLAADLQAVADDAPLRFAREPIPSRCTRWVRTNRRRLAVAAPLIIALGFFAYSLVAAQFAALRRQADAMHWRDMGRHSIQEGRLEVAMSQFATAVRLAEGDAGLRGLLKEIRADEERARKTKEISDKAEELLKVGERLRFSLLGFNSETRDACGWVERALAAFSVPRDANWIQRPAIQLLDESKRDRLISEVNELLFLWVVALDGDAGAAHRALQICDVALGFASPVGPWRAIWERCAARAAGEPPPARAATRTDSETSARGCFQWALLCDLEGKTEAVVAWLERATQLEPRDYWSHFYLGDYCGRIGQNGRAMEHYQAAVALRQDSPWARCNRALLYQARGDWDLALDDLNRALASRQGANLLEARLALGLVKQVKGDEVGARAAYDSVIAAGPGNPFAGAARLNRAKLDIDAGAIDRARAEYDALLALDSRDVPARLSRALLALRYGPAEQSEADLTVLLQMAPERAHEILARRSMARLALGRLEGAEADAAGAYRRRPSPSHERLWARTLLALRRVDDLLWLNHPDDLTQLPGDGPSVRRDLREAVHRLDSMSGGNRSGPRAGAIHRTRAVMLSALNDPSAEAEASRAVALAPESADAYLVRAEVHRRSGNRRAAMADIESALALVPGDPRLLALRGILRGETRNPDGALIDFDRAVLRGSPGSVRLPRARALMALGRDEAAVRDWSLALDDDPEDPEAYLGRATALIRLRRPDRALVDLEQASDWAADNPRLLPQISAAYAVCLWSRPDRFPRWLRLARRAWSAWISTAQLDRRSIPSTVPFPATTAAGSPAGH